ncbi:hypothetical protein BASA81_004122 [Batrachochytrium salamandrivorans]|nr:hypothetical protein BASA81_004122 [Batrachochytrium salamandrivorans]
MEGDREQRNQSATIHVGNLDSLANEDLLWELCYHFGPVERVHIPRDKVTGDASGFGFVEFSLERDAEYASKLLNGVKLFNRSLRVNKATTTAKAMDVGANLFVGGLDESVDEQMLTNIFQAFGSLCKPPQISRDLTTLKSMGYGFLSYDNFAASDAAVEAMNDQFVLNKQIRVMYAFKKGTTERHGSETERLLAQAQQGGYTLAAQFTPSGANQVPVGGAARV